jgi:hypothetical protein
VNARESGRPQAGTRRAVRVPVPPLHSRVGFALATVLLGCGGPGTSGEPEPSVDTGVARPELERVNVSSALTGIGTGTRGADGRETVIACATCHELRDGPHALPASAAELGPPHDGLRFEHGDLPCASCHHPERYDQVRLADGTALPLTEAMRLCSQCHGPQARDFARGAHGGMRGYWDLSRGPRERNGCVDCHDAHAPAFPVFTPAPPPRDRFLPVPDRAHGGQP